MSEQIFYVATNGNDRWSGTLPEPNADKTDGPFATIIKARDHVRYLKQTGQIAGTITFQIRGGRYPLTDPLTFRPDDSAPVRYTAYPGEQPIIDGGTAISGWKTETVNGKSAWTTIVPEVANGSWYFRQLFVNGQRRTRARLPKVTRDSKPEDFYRITGVPGPAYQVPGNKIPDYQIGSFQFYTRPGELKNFKNLEDVEVVALHRWIEERMPITSFDAETNLATSSRCSMFRLALTRTPETPIDPDGSRYYIDNVFEGLTEPGEWYLERATGKLYYIPLPGETPETAEVFAPRLTQFLKLTGTAERPVEYLNFEGLIFEHSEWTLPRGGWLPETVADHEYLALPDWEFAAYPQGAVGIPGVIELKFAHYCSFENCTFQHAGWYGMDIAEGCLGNRIVGNTFTDLGAGGLKISGGDAASPRAQQTGNNQITDNEIFDSGLVFHSGVGVLARHSFGNTIAHNHIHHLFYSGISCGWVWGFIENVSRDNHIEHNHIHDLGFAWLDDMGGIYTLGVQPGTVIRGNLVHDITSDTYGGWSIYTDEGSSHIIIENNIGYNTSHQAFHQHYGRENIIRNNIWAFGAHAQLSISRIEKERIALTFERNITLTRDQPVWMGGYGNDYSMGNLFCDLNLYWSITGDPVLINTGTHHAPKAKPSLEWSVWQGLGYDRHSVIADPKFKNIEAGDFTLAPDSPALALGFVPIDMSKVGPRK